jgi:DNA-binding NarL/FixJ family response regulator
VLDQALVAAYADLRMRMQQVTHLATMAQLRPEKAQWCIGLMQEAIAGQTTVAERYDDATGKERRKPYPSSAAAIVGQTPPDGCPLTPREYVVLGLLAEGLNTPEIAAHLVVSTNTVKAQVSSALRRAGARNATGLVGLAYREGWL